MGALRTENDTRVHAQYLSRLLLRTSLCVICALDDERSCWLVCRGSYFRNLFYYLTVILSWTVAKLYGKIMRRLTYLLAFFSPVATSLATVRAVSPLYMRWDHRC